MIFGFGATGAVGSYSIILTSLFGSSSLMISTFLGFFSWISSGTGSSNTTSFAGGVCAVCPVTTLTDSSVSTKACADLAAFFIFLSFFLSANKLSYFALIANVVSSSCESTLFSSTGGFKV